MPNDKPPNGTVNKPITPALSSRFRNAKTPLAPRLAGSSRPSPATAGPKDTPEQSFSPSIEHIQAQYLNGNITPRSGARTSRISTDSPGTPATNRRLSGNGSVVGTSSTTRQTNATSSPNSAAPAYSRPTIKSSASNVSLTRRASNSSSTSKKDEEPTKFVRANDAKSTTSYQSPKSALSPRLPTNSFLKAGSPRILNSVPTSTFRTVQPTQKEDNFIRANDAQARTSRSPVATRKQSTASLVSMNSARTRSPELSRAQSYPFPRTQLASQASPGKTSTTSVAPKHNSPLKQSPSQSSPAIVSPTSPSDRRRSFGSNISNTSPPRPMLHKKSASVSTFGPPPKFVTSPPANTTHHLGPHWINPPVALTTQHASFAPSSPETLSPRSASLASSKTMGTSVTSDTDISEISKAGLPLAHINHAEPQIQQSILQQLGSTPLAQAQMQAANARRERKVLDLEISNSSLLAINKTLEKELRKQTAELRRFRRLSRSGRLSFAPSNRSVSGQSAISLDTLQEQSEDEIDYTDEEDEESELDELDDDFGDHLGDASDGPTARAQRRARDERRLMLDLSKHQQLLVDSQKLSQTIRKCLSISEDLIKEGNQALVYKVGVGDLKLGGRVLSAEDFDADHVVDGHHKEPDVSRRGLLSPSMSQMELEEAALWLSQYQVSGEAIDRYMHEPPDPG